MSPTLELRRIARLRVTVGESLLAGHTAHGERRVIPITGGTVDGPEIYGEVLPLGADWNHQRADGTETVSAKYLIKTQDGVLLTVLNEGVISDGATGRLGISALTIEAPTDSPYAWLNDAALVGSLVVEEGTTAPIIVLEYWQAVEA